MYKLITIFILLMVSGCKDKYERALDDVTETSIPVRKCELKFLAQENPEFSCGEIEHQFAIEKARALGINNGRIDAAVNIGKLQVDQVSENLIRKGSYLQTASSYRSASNPTNPAWLNQLENEIRENDPKSYEMILQSRSKQKKDKEDSLKEAIRLEMSAKEIKSEY